MKVQNLREKRVLRTYIPQIHDKLGPITLKKIN